jgi:hypothetical protein
MINSFERHRLGWITMKTIPGSPPEEITLRDFITTGDALRIEINANDNLYFYIENHQRISKWDYTSQVLDEKGIYVLRRDYFAKDNNFMKLIPADGRYKWEVVSYEYPDYINREYLYSREENPIEKPVTSIANLYHLSMKEKNAAF